MDKPTDEEIREVIQAAQMLHAFDAGYHFAKKRYDQQSKEAIDKTVAWLKKQKKDGKLK